MDKRKKIFRRIFAALCAFAVAALAPLSVLNIGAAAADENLQTEGNYTYYIKNGEAYIVSTDENISGDITVPSTLGGKPVVALADGSRSRDGYGTDSGVFMERKITSVTLPDTLKYIGDYAFKWSSIADIKIPDSVTAIGSEAFYHAELKKISIPNSVLTINDSAFEGCTNLTDVSIPGNVISLGGRTFKDCTGLKSVVIHDGVEIIGVKAFKGCTNFTKITFPDSLIYVGEYAVNDTAYYDNPSNWNNHALYVGNHLVTTDCKISGSYAVNAGTKTIASYAFENNRSLTEVTIPDSVISLGYYLFEGCKSLEKIIKPDSLIVNRSINEGYDPDFEGDALYVGKRLVKVKEDVSGTFTVKDGTVLIEPEAFKGCKNITEINLPDSVKSINDEAFYNCTELKSINIPDRVSYIGCDTFEKCENLSEIKLPEGIKYMQGSTFSGCKSLKKITLPGSLKVVDLYAFSNCDNLENVIYGNTEKYWNLMFISPYDDGNDALINAKKTFAAVSPYETDDENAAENGSGSLSKGVKTAIIAGSAAAATAVTTVAAVLIKKKRMVK